MTNGSPPCLRMAVKKHDEDTLGSVTPSAVCAAMDAASKAVEQW